MQEASNGGVTASIQQIDTPGIVREIIGSEGIEEVESSNVDLAEELPEMISTKTAYSANIKDRSDPGRDAGLPSRHHRLTAPHF